jgi:thiamine kinase-like enzyme
VTAVLPAAREPVAIDQVIARIAVWRGRAVTIRPLPNGITNTNYRVDVDGTAFVVRIPGAATGLLGIDRASEHHASVVAAGLGLGPRVLHHLPDLGVMVCEFIHGRTLTVADFQAPGMPARVAGVIRRLHAGPPFRTGFDMLRLLDGYLAFATARGLRVPPDLPARLPALRRIEASLRARPAPPAPCHNDLLPENWIDDGQALRVVDYEYSGNNDPAFELGNLAQEVRWDAGQIAQLCAAYYGAATEARLARVMLHTIVSDAGWALWAAVQAAISRIAFDFWQYGIDRWTRATAKLDGPELAPWLDATAAPG